MYLERMHLSWLGPLGQELSAETHLIEGARVTLHAWNYEKQW